MKNLRNRIIYKNDVYEVCYPFFIVLKFYGLAVFDLKSSKFKCSVIETCLFVLRVGCSFYFSSKTISNQYYSVGFSKILNVGMKLAIAVPQLIITFVPILNFVQRKKHHKIYRKIHEIDLRVNFKFSLFN